MSQTVKTDMELIFLFKNLNYVMNPDFTIFLVIGTNTEVYSLECVLKIELNV